MPNSGANTNGKMGRVPKKINFSFVCAGYVSSDGASLGLSKGGTGPGHMAKTDCFMAMTDEVVSSDIKHAQSQSFSVASEGENKLLMKGLVIWSFKIL